MIAAIRFVEFFYLIYFSFALAAYFALNAISFFSLRAFKKARILEEQNLNSFSGLEPSISVLLPAFNEEKLIVESVQALLQLHYGNYEIVVVNDGSKDKTLELLQREFHLKILPQPYEESIPTERVRAVYYSTRFPKLRVVDKENGGKGDALNAAINFSRSKLVCSVDADSVLSPLSLLKAVQPFIEDSATIASGGQVRVLNGCERSNGFVRRTHLPKNWLVRMQALEYLRAFLFGRLGWTVLNGTTILSGAFALFDKKAIIEAGGYCIYTRGEDVEIVLRLHRIYSEKKKKYRILFVPDPMCWTEVPETLSELRKQRETWHRSIGESVAMNAGLLFRPDLGPIGWLATPFLLCVEIFGAFFEVFGLVAIAAAWALGVLWVYALLIFFLLGISANFLLSMNALYLEEISYHVYDDFKSLFQLVFTAMFETPFYRLLTAFWRFEGLVNWARTYRRKSRAVKERGSMPRHSVLRAVPDRLG